MKKITLTLISLGFVYCLFSQNVEINVNKSSSSWGKMIVVEGYTSQKLYLGATVKFHSDYVYMAEFDFKDVPSVKGEIYEKFYIPADFISRIADGVYWSVALWEKKVKNCGCKYCNKNGFHMEGRVTSDNWRY